MLALLLALSCSYAYGNDYVHRGKGACRGGKADFAQYRKEPIPHDDCKAQCDLDVDCLGYNFWHSGMIPNNCYIHRHTLDSSSVPSGWTFEKAESGGTLPLEGTGDSRGNCYEKRAKCEFIASTPNFCSGVSVYDTEKASNSCAGAECAMGECCRVATTCSVSNLTGVHQAQCTNVVHIADGLHHVIEGTTCLITAESGYTCTSPGLCGSDGNFSHVASCRRTCTVPNISVGVQSWSGGNCASGSSTVVEGTTCQIIAAIGYACASPGLCGSDGDFANVGVCSTTTTTTVGKIMGYDLVLRAHRDNCMSCGFVDTDMCWSESGILTAVEAYAIAVNRSGHKVRIMRPMDKSSNEYAIIAESENLTYDALGINRKVLSSPLAFLAGDCVGWVYENGGSIAFSDSGPSVYFSYFGGWWFRGVGSTITLPHLSERTYSYRIEYKATTSTTASANEAAIGTIMQTTTAMPAKKLDVVNIQGTFIMKVSNASSFVKEPNIRNVLKIAIAQMCEVDVSWVHSVNVSLANGTRLAGNRFLEALGEKESLHMYLADEVRVEFLVVVPPNGGAEYLSVTVITENFDALSIEETNNIINTVIESNYFGKAYETVVTYKEVEIVYTSPFPSAADENDALLTHIVFVLCISCILVSTLTIWYFLLRRFRRIRSSKRATTRQSRKPLRGRSKEPLQKDATFLESAGPMGESTLMELLYPPPVISEECHRQILQLISRMMCDIADGETDAFVLYADGHRPQDATDAGPGIYHAAAVLKAFYLQGLGCILPLPGVLDSGDFLTLLRTQTSGKTLLVVETVDLFSCPRCLEALYVAQNNSFDLKRIRIDGTSDRMELRWPCISAGDTHAVDMIKTLESGYFLLQAYPFSQIPVLKDPGSLEATAVEIALQCRLMGKIKSIASSDSSDSTLKKYHLHQPLEEISRLERSKEYTFSCLSLNNWETLPSVTAGVHPSPRHLDEVCQTRSMPVRVVGRDSGATKERDSDGKAKVISDNRRSRRNARSQKKRESELEQKNSNNLSRPVGYSMSDGAAKLKKSKTHSLAPRVLQSSVLNVVDLRPHDEAGAAATRSAAASQFRRTKLECKKPKLKRAKTLAISGTKPF